MLDAEVPASIPKVESFVTTAVVSHDTGDGDTEAFVISHGRLEERYGAFRFLVRQNLGAGDAGVIVDTDMNELPADATAVALTGAVAQTIDTACAEPFDPFGHRLRRGVELARGGGIAQSRFHTPHHGLSTFRRQGSILVAVHLVSPWNTEASQPQLPRFGPDEQPLERLHLALALCGAVVVRAGLGRSCGQCGNRNRDNPLDDAMDVIEVAGAVGKLLQTFAV